LIRRVPLGLMASMAKESSTLASITLGTVVKLYDEGGGGEERCLELRAQPSAASGPRQPVKLGAATCALRRALLLTACRELKMNRRQAVGVALA
jgi:hypothetical protein